MSDFNAVPRELREYDQWILWKLVERDGKATKVPCDATGKPVPVNDPASWLSFDDACAAHAGSDKTSGIGFCFTEADPFVGIDLDDCLPLAGDGLRILERFRTYAEVSPSGTGVKLIGLGSLPGGARNRTKDVEGFGQIEVYDRDRFFTITGNMFGLCGVINDVPMAWLVGEFLAVEEAPVTLRTVEGASSLLERASGFEAEDDQLIEYLRTDPRYDMLWEGDTSDYGDDHSAADLALLEKIAWLAGPVPERIERIFSQSALAGRSKWDRPDYRERSIAKALEGKTDFYNGTGHAIEAALDAGDLPTQQDIANEHAARIERDIILGPPSDDLPSFPIPETGIIRDVVDLIGPMVETPDSTLALGTLVMLSAVAGWERPFASGTSEEPCTLYVVITGPSAKGRKTTGLRNVENVFREAFTDEELRLESAGHISGRGLIELAVGGVDVFYTKEPKITAVTEEERMEQQEALAAWHAARNDKLNNPPAVVLLWDEFAKLLSVDGDWQRDTRGELLAMYNGRHRGIRTSGKEGLKMPAGKVQMALLGTMTTDDLKRGLNSAQASDGLMGRIIFTPDGERKPPMAFPAKRGPEYELAAQAIAAKLLRFRERCRRGGDVTDQWTTAARELHQQWYADHYHDEDSLQSILFGRAQAIAKKIACLLAMAEDLDFVDVDHVEVAQQMADITMQVSMEAARAAVESQRDRYTDAVYTALRDGPIRLGKILERGMLGAAEPGERLPEREQRIHWISKDPRLVLVEGEKGKGHRVERAVDDTAA